MIVVILYREHIIRYKKVIYFINQSLKRLGIFVTQFDQIFGAQPINNLIDCLTFRCFSEP